MMMTARKHEADLNERRGPGIEGEERGHEGDAGVATQAFAKLCVCVGVFLDSGIIQCLLPLYQWN